MQDEQEFRGLKAINSRFSLEWQEGVLHVRPTRFWSREDAEDYLTAYRAMVQLGAQREHGWFKCIDLRSLQLDETSAEQLRQLQSLNSWSLEQGLRGIAIIENPELPSRLQSQVESGYSEVGVPLVWVADETLAVQEFKWMRRRRVGKPSLRQK